MNTNQTPEEIKERAVEEMVRWIQTGMLPSKREIEKTNSMYNVARNSFTIEIQSLSTEIERLKAVCDSMAERNRELERCLTMAKIQVYVTMQEYPSSIKVYEEILRVLSNQNNKK